MSMKDWEKKVLAVPGAPERVAATEEELRLPVPMTDRPGTATSVDDGAPALVLVVEVPRSIDSDPVSAHVAVRLYRVYARQGTGYYRITFMTYFKDYTSEEPLVAPVLGHSLGNA